MRLIALALPCWRCQRLPQPMWIRSLPMQPRPAPHRTTARLTTEGAVKEVDLTGDGKPDTVVDEALFKCSTAASLFNGGTGGSMVHFLADGSETARLVQGLGYRELGRQHARSCSRSTAASAAARASIPVSRR